MAATARRRRLTRSLFALLLGLVTAVALAPNVYATPCPSGHLPSWRVLPAPSSATFHGLAVANVTTAWIGSDSGTVMRTVDGGRSWRDVSPPGAVDLHFRDIVALDAARAIVMTAGPGSDSRLYLTTDGGTSWRLAYQATDPAFFFDGMAFFDSRRGLAVADPIDGKFQILSTADGGRSWALLPTAGIPSVPPDEYGFADSGSMITTAGGEVWFGTGGSAVQIFHSRDGGLSWDVRPAPIVSGHLGGAGVFGLAFRTANLGLAVGGDLDDPDLSSNVSAVSYLGHPWMTPAYEPSGMRAAAAWLPFTLATAVTVGLNGSDVSYDAGQHWTRFDDGEYNNVTCAPDGSCWAVGDGGRVAVLQR